MPQESTIFLMVSSLPQLFLKLQALKCLAEKGRTERTVAPVAKIRGTNLFGA
jgi:hypothetical protein